MRSKHKSIDGSKTDNGINSDKPTKVNANALVAWADELLARRVRGLETNVFVGAAVRCARMSSLVASAERAGGSDGAWSL